MGFFGIFQGFAVESGDAVTKLQYVVGVGSLDAVLMDVEGGMLLLQHLPGCGMKTVVEYVVGATATRQMLEGCILQGVRQTVNPRALLVFNGRNP